MYICIYVYMYMYIHLNTVTFHRTGACYINTGQYQQAIEFVMYSIIQYTMPAYPQ